MRRKKTEKGDEPGEKASLQARAGYRYSGASSMGRSMAQGIRELKEGLNTKEEPEEEQPRAAVEGGEKLSARAAQKEGEPQKKEATA